MASIHKKLISKYLDGSVVYKSPLDVELTFKKDPESKVPVKDLFSMNPYNRLLELKYNLSDKLNNYVPRVENPMDLTILSINGTSTYKPTAELILRDLHGTKNLSFSDYLGLAPVVVPAAIATGVTAPEWMPAAASTLTSTGFWGNLIKDIGTYYVGDEISKGLTGKNIGTHINDALGLEDEHPVGELIGFSGANPTRKLIQKTLDEVARNISPKYALSRAIEEAPLDYTRFLSELELAPAQQPLYSSGTFESSGGGNPFFYLKGHTHNIEIEDLGRLLARQGLLSKNPKVGQFLFVGKLPHNKTLPNGIVETLSVYPDVLLSVNPELPKALWGIRQGRNVSSRVIDPSEAGSNLMMTNKVIVLGFVDQSGRTHVVSAYPYSNWVSRDYPRLINDLTADEPTQNAMYNWMKWNDYWKSGHAIVEPNFTPALPPYKNFKYEIYNPYTPPKVTYPVSETTTDALWNVGKSSAKSDVLNPSYKTRLMNQLKLTSDEADLLIQLQLRNLDNVELVDLGRAKIGRNFGETIPYTVGGQSGDNLYNKLLNTSDWLPKLWSELKYLDFISGYPNHVRGYDMALKGITRVSMPHGSLIKLDLIPKEEARHVLTRGGTDPNLASITEHNKKLALDVYVRDPMAANPEELRNFGFELDEAWNAGKEHLPKSYNGLSESAKREKFFYDLMKASDDGGASFYLEMPPEFINKYGVGNNRILTRGSNVYDPDEGTLNFWNNFVLNNDTPYNTNNLNIT